MRKYAVNESYFDKIDSPQKAYWLGFIAGDGCVYRNALKISVHSKDREHIEIFKRHIETEAPIRNIRNKEAISLRIYSKKLVESLGKWNIVKNKSLILEWPPALEFKYYRHYIRGVFDADGCWYVGNRKDASVKNITFSVTGGSRKFLENLQEVLIGCCHLNKTQIKKRKDSNCFDVRYGGRHQLKRVYDFLYRGSEVYLHRKKSLVQPILENRKIDLPTRRHR